MNWINVKDKLPDEGSDVLCIRKIGCKYFTPEGVEFINGIFNGFEEGIDYSESTDIVSHWMPMPEPPKD